MPKTQEELKVAWEQMSDTEKAKSSTRIFQKCKECGCLYEVLNSAFCTRCRVEKKG